MVFQISNDLNLQKLAQVSHSYAFETPEIEIHDFNSFLFNSLIFHFEIHTAAEAKDNPKDLFHQSLSSGQRFDPSDGTAFDAGLAHINKHYNGC